MEDYQKIYHYAIPALSSQSIAGRGIGVKNLHGLLTETVETPGIECWAEESIRERSEGACSTAACIGILATGDGCRARKHRSQTLSSGNFPVGTLRW